MSPNIIRAILAVAAAAYAEADMYMDALRDAEFREVSFLTQSNLKGLKRGHTGQPAVILLHDQWGLGAQARDHAEHLGQRLDHAVTLNGKAMKNEITVVVPDLFHGKVPTTSAEAKALMEGLDFPALVKEIAAIAAQLRGEGAPSVGVIGFSMGGALALGALGASDDIKCGVTFYGVDFALFDPAAIDHKAVQAHFGSDDMMEGFSDAPTMTKLDNILDGKRHDNAGEEIIGKLHHRVWTYSGSGHGFMNNFPVR